jgi:hypothetical protein
MTLATRKIFSARGDRRINVAHNPSHLWAVIDQNAFEALHIRQHRALSRVQSRDSKAFRACGNWL